GYQYIENLKNARELILREYDDTNTAVLPDERYAIRLRYYDNAQLNAEREAYKVMVASFETEVEHLWDVLNTRYEDSKFLTRVTDFKDLANLYKRKIRKQKDEKGQPVYESIAKVWDEISFIKPAETDVEKMNRTYLFEKDKLRKKLIIMRDKLKHMYDYQYPIERRVMEERLAFLETEFIKFDYIINPFHLQPGLLLDVDITSIKRKKATLDGMANVLNEFLHGVSKGFQDAAFASFSRRRSTVRADIAQTFATNPEEDPKSGEPAGRSQYLDMINEEPAAPAIAAPVAAPRAAPVAARKPVKAPAKTAKAGVVDSGRGRRGKAPAAKGKRIREI
ncbi:MAG TPA: cytoplasmic filament protein CfpA, partial [Treponemataceae bacterium]|nr:cytoplasmic filament protein CfpA [Treponemataceae bacterium]